MLFSYEGAITMCMNTKVEGLVLSKIPFQERHLIVTLLLRSGKKITILCYGGQGGGKKKKSSILEFGFMLAFELSQSKTSSTMYQAKEWKEVWIHNKIRENHKAFYLMCLYLEILNKLAVEANLHDKLEVYDQHSAGLFSVASNGLSHMEKSLKSDTFELNSDFFLFLGKTLIDQGVFPHRENCVLCGEDLMKNPNLFLVPEQGGFSCKACVNKDEWAQDRSAFGRLIWELLGIVANKKYSEVDNLPSIGANQASALFQFFCYQLQFHPSDFKSLSMVL